MSFDGFQIVKEIANDYGISLSYSPRTDCIYLNSKFWNLSKQKQNEGRLKANNIIPYYDQYEKYDHCFQQVDSPGKFVIFYPKQDLDNLLETYKNNPFFHDSDISFLEEVENTIQNAATIQNISKSKVEGYIYLIKTENGLCKIGKAKNLQNRLKPFGVKFPICWNLIYHFKSRDYSFAEHELHQRYSHKRKIGEWFDLSDEEISEITAIKDFSL